MGDTCHWCDGAKVFRGQPCERCHGTGKIQAIQGWWSQVAGYRESDALGRAGAADGGR